ncbi:Hsp70 family protein [Lysobacter sp. FW306-1B-D06B]|uniref:Hsp70 family protein n=1 Tax=Lysobacter sp. FW306-1B-D06B TaxID=3140250 RepID=UPI003140729E
MRIGIDFGTSYSAAGAVIEGKLQLIQFGADQQFRTTVFFPQRLPDLSEFELTDALQDEIQKLTGEFRRDQSKRHAELRARREEAMRRPEPQRTHELSMIPSPRVRTDLELERDARALVRRRWAAEEMRKAMLEGADLQQALYGEEAVDAFIEGSAGQLVVSPKSMLGYRLEARARDTLLGIATQLLRHIRLTASAQLGCDVRAAILGRPVRFRSSMKEAGGVQALEILTDASYAAGFDEVEFLEEPAAAAYGYHQGSERPRRTLILDIGGGTTDMAVADVGGPGAAPIVHGSWGEPVGGTDVDIELSMRSVMPLFGKGVTDTPVHRFYEASAVQDLQRQAKFRETSFEHVVAPYGHRLETLKEAGHAVRLNRAVERAKIRLSEASNVTLGLDFIEAGLLAHIDAQRLSDAATPFLFQLRSLMERARAELNAPPETVYLTGGMSRSPYVPLLVKEIFPDAELVAGNASLGVVTGLAHAAASHRSDQK